MTRKLRWTRMHCAECRRDFWAAVEGRFKFAVYQDIDTDAWYVYQFNDALENWLFVFSGGTLRMCQQYCQGIVDGVRCSR